MKKSIKKVLVSVMIFLVAVFIFIQEWIWDTLKPIFEYLSKFRIIHKIEDWIRSLGLYSSLGIFVIPFVFTHLLELLALGLIATGKVFTGVSLYVLSKIIGYMLLSRIFTLTKDKIMTVRWFRITFDWFIDKKDYLYSRLESMPAWQNIKKLKQEIGKLYRKIKSKIIYYFSK